MRLVSQPRVVLHIKNIQMHPRSPRYKPSSSSNSIALRPSSTPRNPFSSTPLFPTSQTNSPCGPVQFTECTDAIVQIMFMKQCPGFFRLLFFNQCVKVFKKFAEYDYNFFYLSFVPGMLLKMNFFILHTSCESFVKQITANFIRRLIKKYLSIIL